MYGPTHSKDKQTFWNIKGDLARKELIIARDFNATKAQAEKRGGSKIRDPYREYVEDLDLIDLPLKNGKYTGSN